MFLAIEGRDCTGKTTVSKLFNNLGFVSYKTPPKSISAKRDAIDANATPIDHYHFYLNGIQIASREIEQLLSVGKNVVVDRYWLSTYVYHVVMGLVVKIDDFSDIVKPDLTVLLTVSNGIQAKRFIERGMSIGDRRMINRQAELDSEYKKAVKKFVTPRMIISTDDSSPMDIFCKIKSEL
jgi:dTMP kinase/UMP-CMP kinase 2